MKCDFCGNESPAGSQFCVFCGRDFPQPEPEVRLPIVEPDPAPPVIRPTVQTSPPPDPAPLEQVTPPAPPAAPVQPKPAAERVQGAGETPQQAKPQNPKQTAIGCFTLIVLVALCVIFLRACVFKPAKKPEKVLTGDVITDYENELEVQAMNALDEYITDYKWYSIITGWQLAYYDDKGAVTVANKVSRTGTWEQFYCVLTPHIDSEGNFIGATPHFVSVGYDIYLDDGYVKADTD